MGVSDCEVANEVESLAEIGVPEFVATGECLEGSFIDYEALFKRSIGASD